MPFTGSNLSLTDFIFHIFHKKLPWIYAFKQSHIKFIQGAGISAYPALIGIHLLFLCTNTIRNDGRTLELIFSLD
jgi:hypothetical protein